MVTKLIIGITTGKLLFLVVAPFTCVNIIQAPELKMIKLSEDVVAIRYGFSTPATLSKELNELLPQFIFKGQVPHIYMLVYASMWSIDKRYRHEYTSGYTYIAWYGIVPSEVRPYPRLGSPLLIITWRKTKRSPPQTTTVHPTGEEVYINGVMMTPTTTSNMI